MSKEKPGSKWDVRIEAAGAGWNRSSDGWPSDPTFDELVIEHPRLHLEQMSKRRWLLVVGDYRLMLVANKDGTTSVLADGRELSEYGVLRDA